MYFKCITVFKCVVQRHYIHSHCGVTMIIIHPQISFYFATLKLLVNNEHFSFPWQSPFYFLCL